MRYPLYVLLLGYLNTGCMTFVGSGKGGAPYLLGTLAIAAAFVGERGIKSETAVRIGWAFRILGIVLFLLA